MMRLICWLLLPALVVGCSSESPEQAAERGALEVAELQASPWLSPDLPDNVSVFESYDPQPAGWTEGLFGDLYEPTSVSTSYSLDGWAPDNPVDPDVHQAAIDDFVDRLKAAGATTTPTEAPEVWTLVAKETGGDPQPSVSMRIAKQTQGFLYTVYYQGSAAS